MLGGRPNLTALVSYSLIFVLLTKIVKSQGDERYMRCDELDGLRNDRINCTSSGEVSCYEGWTGDLCNNAICREGCHSVHGYCTQPGECKCALGWRGKNCDECVPLPGCKHGFCSRTSYECICEPGWEGNYCSIPVCLEGCHSTRGYCKFPNECRCRIGWGGDTCEECKPLPGCLNGYCTKPLECRCREGWTGLHCDTPTCKPNCSAEHGFCLKPLECRCEVGWWGDHCETCFPYPGCKHGTCESPWDCNCEEGWKGILCDQRNATGESFCEKNQGICLNGGTCINIPDERNYTCSCPTLFTGEHCDYLAYSRASIFPIFSRGSSGSRTPLSTTSTSTSTTVSSSTTAITTTPFTVLTTSTPASPERPTRSSNKVSKSIFSSVSVSSTSTSSPPIWIMKEENKTPSSSIFMIPETTTDLSLSADTINETNIAISKNTDDEPETEVDISNVDDRRRKYFERKSQGKTSSKQSSNLEKERVFSNIFPNRRNEYFSNRRIEGNRSSYKPKLIDSEAPILVLELSEPTLDFDGSPLEDPIENTDANSPQANQINGKNRYIRHHEEVLSLSSDERTGQQSSFFPLREIRLVSQEIPPRPSNLRASPFILAGLDSLPQESSNDKKAFEPFNDPFTHLIPQTRINRRTGAPPSTLTAARTGDLNRFSLHDDHELTEATDSKGQTNDKSKKKSYYEEHYAGRVHIGDVTEVDEHAPLEEIVDAFIELKKLTS